MEEIRSYNNLFDYAIILGVYLLVFFYQLNKNEECKIIYWF